MEGNRKKHVKKVQSTSFSALLGGPERTWKHILYKKGGPLSVASLLDRKMTPKDNFGTRKKFENWSKHGTKIVRKKSIRKNALFFFHLIFNSSYS